MTSPMPPRYTADPERLRVVVLVSGTGSLLQAIVDAQAGHYQVVKVVADKECHGISRAQDHGIDTEVVALGADRAEWNQRLVDAVDAAQPDVVVSAGFMKILGKEFLDRFEGRTINTHPALLPAFKGAHAVRDPRLWREDHRLYRPFCGFGSGYRTHHRAAIRSHHGGR